MRLITREGQDWVEFMCASTWVFVYMKQQVVEHPWRHVALMIDDDYYPMA